MNLLVHFSPAKALVFSVSVRVLRGTGSKSEHKTDG